jgi:lipid-binding SYLF domain-containing protein
MTLLRHHKVGWSKEVCVSKFILIAALSSVVAFGAAGDEEKKRLGEAATLLDELAGAGDKGIPKSLLDKAACAVVVPAFKKGGFIVAGQYGRGFASCRGSIGGWRAPMGVKLEGGSFGLQAGGESADVVMLVMNQAGMERLTSSKFTLGGEASVAAGPVGRDAQAMTDATMKAEILSYSRAKGVFGGISLKGSTLRPDGEANEHLYGKGTEPKAIVEGKVKNTADGQKLTAVLGKYSPKKTN